MSGRKSARKSASVTPKHGRGKLLAGGQFGNIGGGRPPDEFKRICQALASRDETLKAVQAILEDPSHPAYLGALKWASENGYGKPQQPVDLTSGNKPLRFTLAIGHRDGDD